MGDFAGGLVAGVMFSFVVASIVFLAKKWRDGDSMDAAAPDRETYKDPDLSRAMIEHSLGEAAAQVVAHGLSLAEQASEHPATTVWQMRAGKAAQFISPGLFTSLERLSIAVRANRGEKLTDIELGVLHGVLKPQIFRKDAMPVLLLDDAS